MSSYKKWRQGMDLQVFIKCIQVLENSYDRFNITTDKTKLMLWYEMLGDRSEIEFMLGVKKYISSNEFPPTIAGINKSIADITTSNAPDGMEAWNELQMAIRRFGMYREQEALESLSNRTRNVVKALGFKNLCISENQMADRAHFLKMFESMSSRERDFAITGSRLSNEIKQLAQNMSLRLT